MSIEELIHVSNLLISLFDIKNDMQKNEEMGNVHTLAQKRLMSETVECAIALSLELGMPISDKGPIYIEESASGPIYSFDHNGTRYSGDKKRIDDKRSAINTKATETSADENKTEQKRPHPVAFTDTGVSVKVDRTVPKDEGEFVGIEKITAGDEGEFVGIEKVTAGDEGEFVRVEKTTASDEGESVGIEKTIPMDAGATAKAGAYEKNYGPKPTVAVEKDNPQKDRNSVPSERTRKRIENQSANMNRDREAFLKNRKAIEDRVQGNTSYTNIAVTAPDGKTVSDVQKDESHEDIPEFMMERDNTDKAFRFSLYDLHFEARNGTDTDDMPKYQIQVIPLKEYNNTNDILVLLKDDIPVAARSARATEQSEKGMAELEYKDAYIQNGIGVIPGDLHSRENSLIAVDIAGTYQVKAVKKSFFGGYNDNLEHYVLKKKEIKGMRAMIYAIPAGNIRNRDIEEIGCIVILSAKLPLRPVFLQYGASFSVKAMDFRAHIRPSISDGEFKASLIYE